MMAMLQENWLLVVGAVLLGIVLTIVGTQLVKSKLAQKAESATKSAAKWGYHYVGDVASKAESVFHHNPNPAAPAASVAVPPPAAAPSAPSSPGPSAGSGGTDPVTAKHAQIDADLETHNKAIEALLAKKHALEQAQAERDQKQAELDKLAAA